MATPVFSSAGAGDEVTGGTGAPAFPATIAAGDLLVLQSAYGAASTVDTPSGWAIIAGPKTQDAAWTSICFSKVADGTETGTQSLTYTGGAGVLKMARIYRFTGNDTTATPTEAPGTGGDSGNNITLASVATTGTERLAVALVAASGANTTVGSATGETGGNWLEALAEFGSSLGALGVIQLQTADMTGGGTISGGLTSFGTAGLTIVDLVFAIKPFVAPTVSLDTVPMAARISYV